MTKNSNILAYRSHSFSNHYTDVDRVLLPNACDPWKQVPVPVCVPLDKTPKIMQAIAIALGYVSELCTIILLMTLHLKK